MSGRFNRTTKWISTSAWRGYEEPCFFVAGANDTGMWDDSPCPTKLATEELAAVRKVLRDAKIKYRHITTRSSNVFCMHRYLIVTPEDFDRARELVNEYYKTAKASTMLLYVND